MISDEVPLGLVMEIIRHVGVNVRFRKFLVLVSLICPIVQIIKYWNEMGEDGIKSC